jgi:DNA adenine methylase
VRGVPTTTPAPAASATTVVNVASVPQRSPFRYPGGKTWLAPQARAWIASQPSRPKRFVDVFTGGGSVALLAAAEGFADEIVMIELDPDVAAVWHVIVGGDAEALATKIENFTLTFDNVQDVLAGTDASTLALAFRTIVRNRVNRGGILAPGAGLIKAGEANRGLASRWYPGTLARRIRAIAEYRERIRFIEGDCFPIFESMLDCADTLFFVDPPYTAGGKKAGSRLYLHCEVDHNRLFELARAAAGDILITYDNADEVKKLADTHGLVYRTVAMRNTHNAPMNELLVGKDLSWVL